MALLTDTITIKPEISRREDILAVLAFAVRLSEGTRLESAA